MRSAKEDQRESITLIERDATYPRASQFIHLCNDARRYVAALRIVCEAEELDDYFEASPIRLFSCFLPFVLLDTHWTLENLHQSIL